MLKKFLLTSTALSLVISSAHAQGVPAVASIVLGGTGAKTAPQALINLGAAARGNNSDITQLNSVNKITLGGIPGSRWSDFGNSNPVLSGFGYDRFSFGVPPSTAFSSQVLNNPPGAGYLERMPIVTVVDPAGLGGAYFLADTSLKNGINTPALSSVAATLNRDNGDGVNGSYPNVSFIGGTGFNQRGNVTVASGKASVAWIGNSGQGFRAQSLYSTTGDITNGSTSILNVPTDSGLNIGAVWGTGIPAGATITAIVGTTATLSAAATATIIGTNVINTSAFGDTTSGSNTIVNVTNVIPYKLGDTILGVGIPTGTTLTAISGSQGAYTLTMSANATANGTQVPISVGYAGDILTFAGGSPAGLPTGFTAKVVSTNVSFSYAIALGGVNNVADKRYPVNLDLIYGEIWRAKGNGNAQIAEFDIGSDGPYYVPFSPYASNLGYAAGMARGLNFGAGGSDPTRAKYSVPISSFIDFVPNGSRAGKGEVYGLNVLYDDPSPLHLGSTNRLGMVANAYTAGMKGFAQFDSAGQLADGSYQDGYIGSYIQGDVTFTSIVDDIDFRNNGTFIQGPATIITPQESPTQTAVVLGGSTTPMFQVQGLGNTAQEAFIAAGNTGAGAGALQLLLTPGPGPVAGLGAPSAAGDNFLIKMWGDDGLNYQPSAWITLQVAGTVSTGRVPGTIQFWLTPQSGTAINPLNLQSDGQVVIGAGPIHIETSAASYITPSAGEGAITSTLTQGLRMSGRGSSCDVSLQNFGGGNVLCIPTGTFNLQAAGTLTGLTGITSSGTIDLTGLILGGLVANDASGNLSSINSVVAATVPASFSANRYLNVTINGVVYHIPAATATW